MEKRYKLTFLPLFYEDLDRITDYIKYKLCNEIAANKLLDEIEEEINKRSYSPENYEKYASLRKKKHTYYRIYVKNYVVFYSVKDNAMEIARILYSRRNFKDLL